MRRLGALALLASACNHHDKECAALVGIETRGPGVDPVAQLDAIGVRDAKLKPLAARYRASLVAETTKRADAMKAARDVLPGFTLPDAGAEPSVEHVVEDARPLIECLFEQDPDCAELSRVVGACARAERGVTVSAQLLSCAGDLERAKLAKPERASAARAVAASLRAFAPATTGVTVDAAEAMARLSRALPTVRAWQTASADRADRAADIRKACAPAK